MQYDPIEMAGSLRWLAFCMGVGVPACLAPTVALLVGGPSTVARENALEHHLTRLKEEMRRHQLLLDARPSPSAWSVRTPAAMATFAQVDPHDTLKDRLLYPPLVHEMLTWTGPGNDPSRQGHAGEIRLGWPLPVMSVVVLSPPTRGFNALGLLNEIGVGADSGWIETRGTWEVDALDRILPWANLRANMSFRRPMKVCWANIAAMWTAASLALFAAVQCGRTIRRRRRIAAGACFACGYKRADAAVCPECGTSLRSALSWRFPAS